MLVFRWHSEDRKSNVKKSNEKEYQTNEKKFNVAQNGKTCIWITAFC